MMIFLKYAYLAYADRIDMLGLNILTKYFVPQQGILYKNVSTVNLPYLLKSKSNIMLNIRFVNFATFLSV